MNMRIYKMKNIALTIALLICLTLIGCSDTSNSYNETTAEFDSINLPDSELRVAQIKFYKKGVVTSEILAEKIKKFDAEDSTLAYVLDIKVLDSLGNATSTITGDSGIIKEVKGAVQIYGNVIVTTDDSTKLETEYLWWNSYTNRIKSDAFVRITKQDDVVVSGWGLDADNQLKSFKILNRVSGEVKNPNKLESGK